MNLTQQEQNYYELIVDMLDDGIIDDSERSLLNKKKDRYGLSDARAKEIEDFALNEIQNKNKPKFNTEGEEEYYELLEDMLEDGAIDESGRNLLNKRKFKYGISDERAEEFEDYIKGVKGINNTVSDNISNKQTNELLEEGISYFNNKNYGKAGEIFSRAAKLEPNNYLNWQWLSRAFYENRKEDLSKESLDAILKAVNLNPNEWTNWLWLGNAYNGCYNFDEDNKDTFYDAIEAFNKGLKLNNKSSEIYDKMSHSYFMLYDYKKSLECINKAIDFDKNNPDLYSSLSSILDSMGEKENAINTMYKCIRLAQKNGTIRPYYFYQLSELLEKAERYEEALKAYESNINLMDKEGYEITEYDLNKLGELYCFNDRYYDAIEVFNKSMEMNEDDFYDYGFLASSYLNVEDYDNAIYFYEKAIDRYYDNPYLWNDYGVALGRVGRKEDEKEAYRKALELDPDYELARNNLQNCNSGSDIVSGIVKGIGKFFK